MKKVLMDDPKWVVGGDQFDSFGNRESRIGQIVDEGLKDLFPRTGIFPSP